MAELKKELSIFISYAREDIEAAKRLYGDLQKKGLYPWFDQKSILAGEKWEITIKNAIKDCRYFVALLSSNSVAKRGFVNKELTQALEVLNEYPEPEIYIIPVRLDDCTPTHEKLKELQANVTAFDPLLSMEETEDFFKIEPAPSLEDSITNSDCLVIVSAHNEFKELEIDYIAKKMSKPAALVDGRHVFDPKEVIASGLIYRGVGRVLMSFKIT